MGHAAPLSLRAKGTPRPSPPYLGSGGSSMLRLGGCRPLFITALGHPGPTHVALFPLVTTHRHPSTDPAPFTAQGRSIQVDEGPAPPAPAPGHTPASLAEPSIVGSQPCPGGLCPRTSPGKLCGSCPTSPPPVSVSPHPGGAAGTPHPQERIPGTLPHPSCRCGPPAPGITGGQRQDPQPAPGWLLGPGS